MGERIKAGNKFRLSIFIIITAQMNKKIKGGLNK